MLSNFPYSVELFSFRDAELKTGEAVANALGTPMPHSGNFADVYEVRCPSGSRWAVKCFTREVFGLRERYDEIGKHLRLAKLPFMVDFQYLEEGIRVPRRLGFEPICGESLESRCISNDHLPTTRIVYSCCVAVRSVHADGKVRQAMGGTANGKRLAMSSDDGTMRFFFFRGISPLSQDGSR